MRISTCTLAAAALVVSLGCNEGAKLPPRPGPREGEQQKLNSPHPDDNIQFFKDALRAHEASIEKRYEDNRWRPTTDVEKLVAGYTEDQVSSELKSIVERMTKHGPFECVKDGYDFRMDGTNIGGEAVPTIAIERKLSETGETYRCQVLLSCDPHRTSLEEGVYGQGCESMKRWSSAHGVSALRRGLVMVLSLESERGMPWNEQRSVVPKQ